MTPDKREIDPRGTRDEGAVSAEYGVLLGFIALAIIAGIGLYGQNLADFILRLATDLGTWLS